jgi:hypothetical protein
MANPNVEALQSILEDAERIIEGHIRRDESEVWLASGWAQKAAELMASRGAMVISDAVLTDEAARALADSRRAGG